MVPAYLTIMAITQGKFRLQLLRRALAFHFAGSGAYTSLINISVWPIFGTTLRVLSILPTEFAFYRFMMSPVGKLARQKLPLTLENLSRLSLNVEKMQHILPLLIKQPPILLWE